MRRCALGWPTTQGSLRIDEAFAIIYQSVRYVALNNRSFAQAGAITVSLFRAGPHPSFVLFTDSKAVRLDGSAPKIRPFTVMDLSQA